MYELLTIRHAILYFSLESKGSRCPYFPSQDEETRLFDFRDHALVRPVDDAHLE